MQSPLRSRAFLSLAGMPHVSIARASNEGLDRSEICLPFGWNALDALLPDGGIPNGITELTSPRALGLTGYAARLLAALHERERTFAAWIDPEATLFAPGLHERGVDLRRLLVVRPQASNLTRTALKLARSGAFDLLILDMLEEGNDVFIRKLALTETRVLLLTDNTQRRPLPWPVALRLEIQSDGSSGHFSPTEPTHRVRLAKDRWGRIGAPPISLAMLAPEGLERAGEL